MQTQPFTQVPLPFQFLIWGSLLFYSSWLRAITAMALAPEMKYYDPMAH